MHEHVRCLRSGGDDESIATLHRAFDLGIDFSHTSASSGSPANHELSTSLKARRDRITYSPAVIATGAHALPWLHGITDKNCEDRRVGTLGSTSFTGGIVTGELKDALRLKGLDYRRDYKILRERRWLVGQSCGVADGILACHDNRRGAATLSGREFKMGFMRIGADRGVPLSGTPYVVSDLGPKAANGDERFMNPASRADAALLYDNRDAAVEFLSKEMRYSRPTRWHGDGAG